MSCLWKPQKIKEPKLRCKCGYKEHRDIHGARNILTKTLHGKMIYFPIDHPTYLRPVILGVIDPKGRSRWVEPPHYTL